MHFDYLIMEGNPIEKLDTGQLSYLCVRNWNRNSWDREEGGVAFGVDLLLFRSDFHHVSTLRHLTSYSAPLGSRFPRWRRAESNTTSDTPWGCSEIGAVRVWHSEHVEPYGGCSIHSHCCCFSLHLFMLGYYEKRKWSFLFSFLKLTNSTSTWKQSWGVGWPLWRQRQPSTKPWLMVWRGSTWKPLRNCRMTRPNWK